MEEEDVFLRFYEMELENNNGSGIFGMLNSTNNATTTTATTRAECSAHAETIYKFLVGGVVNSGVCCFGIFGNILSGLVLSHASMRSSVNIILLGLSICDLIFVTISLLFYGIPNVFKYFCVLIKYEEIMLPLMVPWLFPVISIAQLGSVYFTVCVTIERFLVVTFPLRARSWCTVNHAIIVSLMVVLFSVIYNLPTWWEYTYIERSMNGTVVAYDFDLTEMRRDPAYVLYYVNWGSFFIFRFIPFVILMVLNIGIYRKVREANRARKTMTQSQITEISIANMLVCIIATFLLCNITSLVLNMRESFTGITASDELIILSSLFVTINSAANFVIYCLMAKKFRNTILASNCYLGALYAGGIKPVLHTWVRLPRPQTPTAISGI